MGSEMCIRDRSGADCGWEAKLLGDRRELAGDVFHDRRPTVTEGSDLWHERSHFGNGGVGFVDVFAEPPVCSGDATGAVAVDGVARDEKTGVGIEYRDAADGVPGRVQDAHAKDFITVSDLGKGERCADPVDIAQAGIHGRVGHRAFEFAEAADVIAMVVGKDDVANVGRAETEIGECGVDGIAASWHAGVDDGCFGTADGT